MSIATPTEATPETESDVLHNQTEAARRLGINRGTLAKMIALNQVRTVPCGDGVRIPTAEIRRLLAAKDAASA